jgi:hypothetical protein
LFAIILLSGDESIAEEEEKILPINKSSIKGEE